MFANNESIETFPPGHSIDQPINTLSFIPLQDLRGLPPGFWDIAATGRLTIHTINVIHRMASYPQPSHAASSSSAAETRNSTAAYPVFFSDDIQMLEKLICLALLRYKVNNTTVRPLCFSCKQFRARATENATYISNRKSDTLCVPMR
jgi:hypothetical protein